VVSTQPRKSGPGLTQPWTLAARWGARSLRRRPTLAPSRQRRGRPHKALGNSAMTDCAENTEFEPELQYVHSANTGGDASRGASGSRALPPRRVRVAKVQLRQDSRGPHETPRSRSETSGRVEGWCRGGRAIWRSAPKLRPLHSVSGAHAALCPGVRGRSTFQSGWRPSPFRQRACVTCKLSACPSMGSSSTFWHAATPSSSVGAPLVGLEVRGPAQP